MFLCVSLPFPLVNKFNMTSNKDIVQYDGLIASEAIQRRAFRIIFGNEVELVDLETMYDAVITDI